MWPLGPPGTQRAPDIHKIALRRWRLYLETEAHQQREMSKKFPPMFASVCGHSDRGCGKWKMLYGNRYGGKLHTMLIGGATKPDRKSRIGDIIPCCDPLRECPRAYNGMESGNLREGNGDTESAQQQQIYVCPSINPPELGLKANNSLSGRLSIRSGKPDYF